MDIIRMLNAAPSASPNSVESMIISLLLAFVLGQLLAWVYFVTHSGLSYSRSFVQSLVMIAVVVSMVMSAIANSLVTAVGLMGALAIIRFRNMIKDTRDISFIFSSLVIGMSTGAQRFEIAVVGTLVLCLLVLYMFWSDFGSHDAHNGFIRFRLIHSADGSSCALSVLEKYCASQTLISMEGNGHSSEYAYQVYIRNSRENDRLISSLERLQGIEQVCLTMQEQLLEV